MGITLNAGSGGATLASDTVTDEYQLIKLAHGAAGAATIVSTSSGLPVQQQGDWTLAANSGVDIGDVDVLSVIPGTGATNLGKAEDAAHASGDSGVAVLAVRRDTAAVGSGADGDYSTLNVDGSGRLWVHDDVLDAALSGSELQVDVVAALPAGTNAIGKLAANDGVDIGDVDVASLPSTVHSADYDTGAGTDTTLAFGLAVPASGGAAVIPGDATAGLKVDLGADNDVTVTGSVTANAGTNLNTSALALESGGNLATLAGAVSGTEMQVDVVAALPASTNLIGQVYAQPTTGAIYQGTTSRTPAYAAIDAATSGDNTLVAAQGSGNKIRVYSLFMVAAGTVNARFEDGAGGTALTGQMNLVANTGFVLPYNPLGWFETSANTLLNLELSAAVSVDGSLVYSIVT